MSTLDPAGPAGRSIALLWWAMLAGGTVLFAATIGLLGWAIAAPRRPPGPSGRWIVWGGLVLPGIVLPVLLVFALGTGDRLVPAAGDGTPRVEAEARQWSWTFRYPDEPGAEATVDRLRLPVGRPVDVHVTSRDVIHSFWIPRLAGKIDAIPGHTTVIRIQADAAGTYRAVCSEYCGTGHAGMGFVAEAVSDAPPGPANGTAP